MGNRHTQPRPGLNQQPRTRVDLPNQHTNSRSSPRTLKEQPRKLGLAPPHLHTAGVRRRGLAAAAAALRLPPLLLPHRPRRRLLLPEPPKRTREPPSAAAGDASFSRWTSRGRETLASHHEPRLLERERERKKLPETPSRAEPLLRFRGLGLGGVWVASPFPFLPLSLSRFSFPEYFLRVRMFVRLRAGLVRGRVEKEGLSWRTAVRLGDGCDGWKGYITVRER